MASNADPLGHGYLKVPLDAFILRANCALRSMFWSMVPRAGRDATALRMAGNNLANTISTFGCALCAPEARRGAPLVTAAFCHVGNCTAAELAANLGAAAVVFCNHLSFAAAASWPA